MGKKKKTRYYNRRKENNEEGAPCKEFSAREISKGRTGNFMVLEIFFFLLLHELLGMKDGWT